MASRSSRRRTSMLSRAARVVEQRGKHYGDVRQNLGRIAARWSLVVGVPVTPEQVAVMMIDLKLARLAESPHHADSILDVAGYAELLDRLRQGRK
jgi:hypothetical protein